MEHTEDRSRGGRPDDGARATQARRDFLRAAGLGGLALVLPALGACSTDAEGPTALGAATARTGASACVVLDFSTDVGVLNYAYALEQLEAAFYIEVIKRSYQGMTAREERLLVDVREHEKAHRDFFRAALGANAIGTVTPNFGSIDFTSRASVLGAAKTFEDLGVGAYNGAAHYLSNTTYLGIAGKIVSVEARHAAAIRDLLAPRSGSFAPAAFDPALAPTQVLSAAAAFIASPPISVVNS